MTPEGSILEPPKREWQFTSRKTQEERVYLQQELTIDGEAALIGLVITVARQLADTGFPFQKLADLIGEEEQTLDWAVAEELLTHALTVAPRAGSEAAAILFGYFPTTEAGRLNPEYEEQVVWLRGVLHLADLVEVLEAFATQNDWERLQRPFGSALRRGMTLGLVAQTSGGSETRPSAPTPPATTSSSRRATRGRARAPHTATSDEG